MANTYLISDGYFKEQYPQHNLLDMSKFYSTLLIEQNTTLESILGENLKNWLIENAAGITDGDELKLLKQVQYLLVLLVARQLTVFNTETSDTDARKDTVWQALTGKISYLKNKLKTFISQSETIYQITRGDNTTSQISHEYPIFFPRG